MRPDPLLDLRRILGFMAVGGEWFAMWPSQLWNGQQAAFRFNATLLGVLVFVNQEDPELDPLL